MSVTRAGPTDTLARDAGTVTAWNLFSRLTGFGRVLVVGGALGATRLGDTFHAANQVSNILFEFLAAGTLSAVLVPRLVAGAATGDRQRAEALAGALLARALVVLAAVVVLGMAFARPIMGVLFAGNDDTSTRQAQVRLGAFLLLFVLPQLLLYAWGAVVTAALHAERRFAAAAAAPVANNLVVIAALGVFWARDARGLEIGLADRLLLGCGALGGVLCMTLVPVVAARRAGLRVTPRWGSESLRASVGDIGWASLAVIPAQMFLLGSLVVAGLVPGGVVAIQIAFTVFLLPHALLAHPITTVLYPRVATAVSDGDRVEARAVASRGLRLLLVLTVPSAAALVVLADPLMRMMAFGALDRGAGADVVAAALAGFGVGLTAYSWALYASRVSFAGGDVRTPAVAALLGGVAGAAVLAVATSSDGTALLFRVGVAHSTMYAVAAVITLAVLARRGLVGLR